MSRGKTPDVKEDAAAEQPQERPLPAPPGPGQWVWDGQAWQPAGQEN